MAEKTEDALGGIAAPKAEEAKSAAKTYETPLKEAYEAGDLPAPAVSYTHLTLPTICSV